jgi:hypothetical protein
MRWGLFFLGLLLLGLVYEISELYLDQWGKVDLFLCHDREMYPSSYIYYSNENIGRIILALGVRKLMLLVDFLKPFSYFATAFVILESIDLVDFWLTRNSLWFEFRGYPITFNVLKIFIFTVLFGHEFIHRNIAA